MIKYILAIFSGLLLGIPFKFPSYPLLAWVALIPFLFSLEGVTKKKSFYLGWSWGLAFLIISGYWLLNPLANFSGYPASINILIFLAAMIFIGVYFAITAFLIKLIKEHLNISLLYIVPVVWTTVEFIRSIFSFEYSFGFIGYSQAFIPELIQLAAYGGVYLVTFLIILVNTLLYLAVKNKNYKYGLGAIFIFVLVFTLGSLNLQEDLEYNKELKVGVIQPNISQTVKVSPRRQDDVTRKILNLTAHELEKGQPDLLIWPETAILRRYYEDQKFPYYFQDKTPLLIGGHIAEGEDDVLNSLFLVDGQREIIQRYSKVNLVPFGEYVPFPQFIPDIIETNLNHITPGRDLISFEYQGFSWISPICSEILDPFYLNSLYQQEDFIINISNEAWFGRSHAPLQILQSTIFRAVEHQVPVVKVGNTGISGVIDSKGRVLKKTEIFKTRSFTFNLKIPVRQISFYDKVGNLFGWVILLTTGLLALIAWYRYKLK